MAWHKLYGNGKELVYNVYEEEDGIDSDYVNELFVIENGKEVLHIKHFINYSEGCEKLIYISTNNNNARAWICYSGNIDPFYTYVHNFEVESEEEVDKLIEEIKEFVLKDIAYSLVF